MRIFKSKKKSLAWLLGIVMIISAIQMPAFGMNVKAADNVEAVVLDEYAEDGQGVRYSFSKDDNFEAFAYLESDENIPEDGNVTIPSRVSWQGTEYVVKGVEEYGFQKGNKLRNVVLPSTVERIFGYAFAGLTNLESVTTDSNNVEIRNNAFENCTSLSTFLFNGGTIGESSFKGCSSLSDFNFANVTSISQRAFDGCINLTDVNLPACVEYVGDSAFSSCPDTIIVACDSLLDESYFWWNENMVRAQHTEPVYGGCIDDGTSHVWNCEKCGMTVIGKHVLNKERQCEICGATIEVYIEDLTDVDGMKDDSQGLRYILGATEEGNYASLYTWSRSEMPHTEWLVVPDVVRSDGEEYPVTALEANVFERLRELEYIELPSGLKKIGESAFWGVTRMTSIELPEGLELIEDNAFRGNVGLESIYIPASVNYIGNYVFYGCTNLKKIVIAEGSKLDVNSIYWGVDAEIVDENASKEDDPSDDNPDESNADEVTIDGIIYQLSTDENTAKVIGYDIDQMSYDGEVLIPSHIDCAEKRYYITEIAEKAFENCYIMWKVYLPETIVAIGDGAFDGCSSLGRFGIACRSLLEISTSWGVDSDLILYEHDMTKVDAVLSCTDVGSPEYFVCSYEPDVYYVDEDGRSVYDDYQSIIVAPIPHMYEDGKCIYCGKDELNGTEYEDDGIIYLLFDDGSDEAAVIGYNDEHLADNTKLVIEGSMFIYGTNYTVTSILSNAFANCDKLRSVRIADSITNIGDNAFANCKNLEWIKFECGSNMVANENWGIDAKIVSNDWHRYSLAVPTDNQDGTHQKVCEKCHQTINEAHDYTARTYQKEALAVPATCTEPAKYYFLCDCGLMSSDDTYEAHQVFDHVDAYGDMPLGHNMVKVEESEPTCTKDGNVEYWICTNEPDVYYMDEDRVEKYDGYEAIAIPMISHAFEDGKCIACGELASKQVVARGDYLGVVYELYDYGNDHFATVVGLSDNTTYTNFTIYEGVDYYEGTVFGEVGRYKVTAIADGAFKGSSRLVYLHIKKNVKEIGDNVFEGCENLRTISLSCDSELNSSDLPEVNQSIVTRFNHVLSPAVNSIDNHDGTHTGKCGNCGKEYVSAHVFHRKTPNEQTRALAATCTTPAAYYFTCDCGAFGYGVSIGPGGSVPNQLWYLDSEPALGHDMTKVAAKAATTTATGNYEYWICSREPDVYYKDKEGTQQFKNWSEVVIPKIINNGWYKYDNKWCYNRDGKRVTGWLLDGKNWYYMDSNGYMKTGWQKIGTKWYYFGTDGVMVTGWKKISNVWYYFDGGAMVTGWKKISSKWYYFDGGAMVTGWQKIGTKWYYFGNDGIMVTGWQKISNNWYYFDGGVMATSRWINNTYYVKSNGVMATNEWIGKYYVDANGKYVPGKRK